MKCSFGISDFLEEIPSLSHSVVFLYLFALKGKEARWNRLGQDGWSLRNTCRESALLRWVGSPKLSVRDAVTQLQSDSSADPLRGSAHTLPFNCEKWKWKSLSLIRLFATPWTVACQAPLSMEFFRQRILEWVAVLFCKGSSQLRNLLHCRQILYRLSHKGRNNISLQTINVIRLDKRGY